MARRVVSVVVLLAVIACAVAGCAQPLPTNPEPPASELHQDGEPGAQSPAPGEDAVPVLMLGRSVMRGWFDHWGFDGSAPVTHGRYILTYREVESPPDIAASASGAIAGAEPGSIVFFKLCFVDFEPGHAAYADRLSVMGLAEFAEQVADAAGERGVTLVLGNALPKVEGETSTALIAMHREYNSEIERIAGAHENVVVFDLYGYLSSDGALRADYAASPGDSHPNDAAYDMLDEALFEQLDRIAGAGLPGVE